MKITLITPGGGRPEAFALCEKYMQRQTVWNTHTIQWIVADDNKKDPVVCTLHQEHIYGDLQWAPKVNTLRYNLDAAIKQVTGDFVFIIENDDYYAPNYLSTLLGFLEHGDLVGYCDVVYYSVSRRSYFAMNNTQHASLCCSAFKKSYIPHFYRAIHSGEQYADIVLWGNAKKFQHKYILFSGMNNLSLGIKGVPGRDGIGVGHQDTSPFIPDPQFVMLKKLLGEDDAKTYMEMIKR